MLPTCSENSEEEIPSLKPFDESPVANCYRASHRHDISSEIWVDFRREMLMHLNNALANLISLTGMHFVPAI